MDVEKVKFWKPWKNGVKSGLRNEKIMAERSKHIISSFDAALDVLKNDVLMMSTLQTRTFTAQSKRCSIVIASFAAR